MVLLEWFVEKVRVNPDHGPGTREKLRLLQ
jgi:hypothetical protein